MEPASPAPETAVWHLEPERGRDANRGAEAVSPPCDAADLLRRNAVWFCRLRWAVAALLAGAGAAGWFDEPFSSWGLRLSPGWPLATAATLVALNVAYRLLLPQSVGRGDMARLRVNVWAQIIADLVVLTVVIHFVGSVETYALFVYLFHIILACIFFTRIEALAVAAGAAALYLACLAGESAGWLAPRTVLARASVVDRTRLTPEFWAVQTGSALLIWGGIWYLASRQAGELRRRERDLALANARLQSGIEERARHMLQTTHQLKAPFAAIHANAQLLLGGYCGELPDAATAVVEKIFSRCAVLSRQIIEMLQLANLRSAAQSRPQAVPVALGELVESVISRVEPTAASRGIEVRATLEPLSVAIADDHLRMLIENLLTNAVNYSYDGGVVEVRCDRADNGAARVAVRDAGIGIQPDKLPRIFDDYFRAKEASAHNKASTGLGLAIVRDVARMWDVGVDVRTAPGRGTEFTLTFPAGRVAPIGSGS
jgi:signal transduction histidine kinase